MIESASAASTGESGVWLLTLRRYLGFTAVANLLWEAAQLPFYTIWTEGSFREQAFAVIHCTAGDVAIAGGAALAAVLVLGRRDWPRRSYWRVAALASIIGFSYTVFSEWVNIEIRGSWAYAPIMPTILPTGSGLAPLVQWIVVPLAAFWWTHRPFVTDLKPKAIHR